MGQLGNGTYTNGNKGSNFSFELKTLQALEQIAILIEAGGSVPGSQNLQQVTTLGNTTTNDIIINSGVLKVLNGAYWQIEPVYLRHYQSSSTNQLTLTARELTSNRGLYLPDADGTLVASVGGVTADDTGNIPIDLPIAGCYTPLFTDGQSTYSFTPGGGHFYKTGNMVQVYVAAEATGTSSGNSNTVFISLPYAPTTDHKNIIGTFTLTAEIIPGITEMRIRQIEGGFAKVQITWDTTTLDSFICTAQFSYMIDESQASCI